MCRLVSILVGLVEIWFFLCYNDLTARTGVPVLANMMKIHKKEGLFSMKDVRSTVMQLSGRWGNSCYEVLCLAVEAARDMPREQLQMKCVWDRVRERTGKRPEAISRALARAASDIWERGSRELLTTIFGHPLAKAPTSKELVFTLSEYVRPKLEYCCWTARSTLEHGIFVKDGAELRLVTEPFSTNLAFVDALIAQLNAEQRPLETFRMQFLTGEIPGVLPTPDDSALLKDVI